MSDFFDLIESSGEILTPFVWNRLRVRLSRSIISPDQRFGDFLDTELHLVISGAHRIGQTMLCRCFISDGVEEFIAFDESGATDPSSVCSDSKESR
jgi:hypothetical protein